MADVFKDQISLRELTPTNLLLPGNGDGGNVVTVSWGGNILKEDMIHVPGLTGCMGIICIARTPIKQAVPQAAAAAANSRVSVNRESVRELSRNSNGYTQYVKDDLQKKANPERNSGVDMVEAYKTYAIHAMGKGHWVAKEKLEKIFAKHPDRNSLLVYFFCTTNYGQLEWIVNQRGEKNVRCYLITSSGVVYDNMEGKGIASLYASPQFAVDGLRDRRRVNLYQSSSDDPVNYSHGCPRKSVLLGEDDGVVTDNDTSFTLKSFVDDDVGDNETYKWAQLNDREARHLTMINRAQWHNKDFCEICKRKVGSRFKSMFNKNLYARHHCRACGNTVCINCCKKLSKINDEDRVFIADDRNLASYICIKCNTRVWKND